ncbi:hypothetical protein B0H21DRAFT_688374 [Amylocystis lapponica]|nr:hypothetical protein B0H21DRAFT_688374 [Amylocystis lapponica]
MDPFGGVQSFWDISQQPNTFSALPDDDFLAFLEKQFPTTVGSTNNLTQFDGGQDAVDPQNLTQFPLSNSTPTSSDSSPSPPSLNERSPSRRQSGVFNGSTATPEQEEPGLKRKASDESIDDEPNHKNQHTNTAGSSKRASSSARRKSTGNPTQDESRLLKRKEQNRAAQRAFRERKEKHVKDLEDKVAALEAKNHVTESENENLRDLLSRLQNENMVLKQAAFTFSVPRDTTNNGVFSGTSSQHPSFRFTSPGAGPSKAPLATPQHQSQPPFNFSSLISFDPSMLNLADESMDNGMNADFGYGQQQTPYKTIAANPMYMSVAEPSPYDLSPSSSAETPNYLGNVDVSSFDQWSSQAESSPLDQLFGGNYLGTNANGVDFAALLRTPPSSISPVSHASLRTGSSSTSDSPSISSPPTGTIHDRGECPRTKEQLSKVIADEGQSPFACEMPMAPFLRKAAGDDSGGPMIMCKGSSFPPTEKSDKNVEVLTAWRSITSNPQFKVSTPAPAYGGASVLTHLAPQDLDINELCTEFTRKARCDGTKVVLEPQGVHCIIESLAAKRQQTKQ